MDPSDFLQEATERGFLHQCTDLAGLGEAGPVPGYIGFDCTADSLHVGSLVQIMMLRLLQKHGHTPVALMGGGTSRIGDPSFRDEARQMLTDAQIAANMAGMRACIAPFVHFGERTGDALMLNNAEWLDGLGYIEMLREVGPHFSISRMLGAESVRARLEREQGLTFLEFNYSILQAYDFRELRRRHGVRLQIGGSDQWGNIVAGVELVRRTDAALVFGLTTKLITTASGAKMGKTAAGAVWLSAARLSPYDYWQFWRDSEDADVGRFLRLFTDLPITEVDRLAALQGAELNEAKRVLANECTTLLHGPAAAEQAAEAVPPTHAVAAAELERGIPLFRLLAESGLVASLGEAKRLIRGGGARVNDMPVTNEAALVTAADARAGAIKLSAGRKQHRLVRSATS